MNLWTPRTHFAIVCMGRSGSTLLQNLLGSHPGIECRGELFGPCGAFDASRTRSIRAFLARRAYETKKPCRGFKMPYDWILRHPTVMAELAALDYRFIRLRRGNPLHHFMSSHLAPPE